MAALAPRRDTWLETATEAKTWLTAALVHDEHLEIGPGPVHHFHQIWGD